MTSSTPGGDAGMSTRSDAGATTQTQPTGVAGHAADAGQAAGNADAGAAGKGTAAAAGGGGTGGAMMGTAGAAGASTASSGPPPGSSHPGMGPAETKPIGYGQDATGGGNGAAMKVDSLSALQAAIDGYSGTGGLVLEYTGMFDFKTISDPCTQHTKDAQKLEIKNKHDITLRGADGSSANFGIHISSGSSNVIVRNMTIGLTPGGGDSDMISLEGMSGGMPKSIWIDHNELFSSLADCPGAGDTAFDGMIDIKKGADNVTVSYNYMHDHHKMSLNGFNDDDDAVRHVTFHHNLFENIGSRTPLQRHGYSHLFNNELTKILTSGINVRMQGYALVEANYFEQVLNPVTSRDSPMVGYWELRDNNLASAADVAAGNAFGITWDKGSSGTVNATDWTTTMMFPAPLGYDYHADSWDCVRDGLRAVAGAGKALATLSCGK